MINASKLRGLIVEKGYTLGRIAEIIEVTPKTMYERMAVGNFRLGEMDKLIDVLEISDPIPIFFTQLVTQEDTKNLL